jgi:hypothetical protein
VECAASQWRQLAEEAEETDKKPLPEKLRQAYSLREIDKAEDAIREIVALWRPNGAGASGIHSSTDATNAGRANSGLDDFL